MKHFCDENGCRLVTDEEFEKLCKAENENLKNKTIEETFEVKQLKSKFLRNIFDQNTYVCLGKNEGFIVDAGAEAEDVKAALEGKKVLGILMTHLHFDHIFNIEAYLKEFDCKVFIIKDAEEKFADANKNASVVLKKNMTFKIEKDRINFYKNHFKLGEFEVEVYETFGHTGDSVCLKIGDKLFTGDTIFSDTIGRTDLYDGSIDEMKKSLRKIKSLDFKVAYPGHGGTASKKQICEVIKKYE